jgi:DNA-binding NtrC family response regulator
MSDFYIAFVDDETDLTEAYQELFESKYKVKTFSCAEDYLDFINGESQNNPFDMTITDYKMGEINGIEMINRAIESHRGCPFILLSGHVDQSLLKKTVRGDALVTLVEKPPDINILSSLIEKMLHHKLRSA